ncbi:MAG: ATPase, AFG1 family [uncultured Thiotrichaceae bacterium]|uniref:ATPase, AFG1 family n=1 Tax=uncultured Thiotrichaceae bacterium TaxID=298394 RepID=A0A6S6U2U4_9GAMM|nr:MAG: ATPase, AFG1 family [uncultured Thiotrichaceae bacterium]
MSLLARYQQDIKSGQIQHDPAQEKAITVLQSLLDELENPTPPPQLKKKGFSFFSRKQEKKEITVKGAYFWGGVGRGKTWIMDQFFTEVNILEKQRYHYHHFMLMVHEELRKLGSGHESPLEEVAKKMAADVELLCIDEFHVLDIGDAMILAHVIEGLMQNDVVIVTTSNRIPDDLYKNGLQRVRFLPAIELIKQHMHIVELDNGVDYRMKDIAEGISNAQRKNVSQSDKELETRFAEMARGEIETDIEITINHRTLPVRKKADNIIWMDFAVLFDGPRATSDYIELAENYEAIIVSDLPVLNEESENPARRFLNFVDELYDQKVQLILSTDVALEAIYQGNTLVFEFVRVRSRLNDMQTPDYLAA